MRCSDWIREEFSICVIPIEALGEEQVAKCMSYGINAVILSEYEIQTNLGFIKAISKGEYDLGELN